MSELCLEVETITPLFLGGADPRGQPELRAASVRGAMRFWLRALLGGVLGDSDLEALRKAESEVFGSTETGASNVVVRLRCDSLTTIPFSDLAKKKPGISYLFFAARQIGKEPERHAIAANSEFELVLSTRAGIGKEANEAFRRAYASLWLLTHLGGLGARSRRGGGSLQVTWAEGIPDDLPSLIIKASTPADLQAELKDGLTRLRQLMGANTKVKVNNPSAFDVLHPDVCKLWVVNRAFKAWDEALNEIGRAMQQFRNRRQPDYENVKAAVQGQPLKQPVERAAFGLPIVFYYGSLRGRRGTLEGERHDRRASPLMIRVTRLANRKYALVLTLFRAELLPAGEKLKLEVKKAKTSEDDERLPAGELESEGSPATIEVPDLSLIDEFLKQLDSDLAPRLEVTGW